MMKLPLALAAALSIAPMPAQSKESPAPALPAAKRPHVHKEHGVERQDDYFWMRDREDPAVIPYLKAENALVDKALPPKGLREKLYREMRARVVEKDLSVSIPDGDWLYYYREEEGKEYTIHCRKSKAPNAPEEIVLDENVLAKGLAHFELGDTTLSPDHSAISYTTNTTGTDLYDLQIKNLKTGKLLPDKLSNVAFGGSGEWSADGKWLFYLQADDTQRSWRLYRHKLGTTQKEDQIVIEEPDGKYSVDLGKCRSGKYLSVSISSKDTTEIRMIDTAKPEAAPTMLLPRKSNVVEAIEHIGDQFIRLTNEGAPNFKLLSAPVADPTKWKEVMPYDPARYLTGLYPFRNHLILFGREGGAPAMWISDWTDGAENPMGPLRKVKFPDASFTVTTGRNPDFNVSFVRFIYDSPVTPQTVIEMDMKTDKQVVLKRQEVIGYDPTKYELTALMTKRDNGPGIPLIMLRAKGPKKPSAMLLEGYGAYGTSADGYFSSATFSLVDRGVIYVQAGIRGGSDFGRQWYLDGKLKQKKNTFSDFIHAAEWLISEGWTSKEQLCIFGASGGGMLMGAVVNERPDLFKAVVAQVPFVDCLNTMCDPTIPLTIGEYEEWGDPNVKENFELIRSYAPYENVKAQAYPRMLVTAGLNDPRVPYWEPAKWVAKLKAMKTNQNPVLFHTHLEAGHGGASGRFEFLKDVALYYAFVLESVGLDK